MSESEILGAFKKGIISFLDELIDQFPEEGDLVIMRIFLKDQIPILDVMNRFIMTVMKFTEEIKDRNESVFLENNILFSDLSKNKVNHFKRLWRSGRLDKDDKEMVWAWLDSFVLMAQKYQSVVSSRV